MSSESMVVVAEAREPLERGIWLDALKQAGVEATSFERGSSAALGGVQSVFPSSHPILVPSSQVATARNVITDLAGARRLLPLSAPSDQSDKARRWIIGACAVALAGLLGSVIVQAFQ